MWAWSCGGKTRTPFRAPEKVPSVAESRLAAAMCGYLTRCEPDGMFVFSGASQEACEEYFSCVLQGHETWSNAAALGDDLDTCVESLESRACGDPAVVRRFSESRTFFSFPWGTACGEVERDADSRYAGTAKLGEACVEPIGEQLVCERGSYCFVEDTSPTLGSVYCGTCASRAEVGSECDDTQPCAEGIACIYGQCAVLLEPGETCAGEWECRYRVCEDGTCGDAPWRGEPISEVLGRACEGDEECGAQAALFCSEGRCRMLPDAGARCSGDECKLGQSCVEGRCVALGCTLDEGESCQSICHEGACVDGVCEPAPEQVGAPCTALCGGGLECLAAVCAEGVDRSNGAGCDSAFDCDSFYCDRDVSEFCDENRHCIAPACDKCGTCAPRPTNADCQ